MSEFVDQDLSGSRFERVRFTGEFRNVTINGVDIGPLVEAELNRRMPDRAAMRPTDADGFRHAWATLERLWEGTVRTARALPPGWDGIPWDRDARPTPDEVLDLRRGRQAMVGAVIAALTDEQLASTVSRSEPGWPQIEQFPFAECLLIVLNEEWEHRLYAERDLAALSRR